MYSLSATSRIERVVAREVDDAEAADAEDPEDLEFAESGCPAAARRRPWCSRSGVEVRQRGGADNLGFYCASVIQDGARGLSADPQGRLLRPEGEVESDKVRPAAAASASASSPPPTRSGGCYWTNVPCSRAARFAIIGRSILDPRCQGTAMTLAQLIPIVIQISMALILFCVGLHARLEDITSLWSKPGLLLRSLLAMNVVMPVFAVLVAVLFDLNVVVEAALIAMALSPIPPILPNKEIKAGGGPSYIIGVLVVTGVLSIVFVPLAARLLGEAFGRSVNVSPVTIARIVTTSILLPLLAGVGLRKLSATLADRIARPLSVFGTLLLIVAFVPVLLAQWRNFGHLLGNFSLLAIVAFVVVGLAVGHLLGGPDPDDRTVLALSTATRHPAVAMAIVHEAHDKELALGAVLLVLLVGGVVSVPYVKWRRRSHDATAFPPRTQS